MKKSLNFLLILSILTIGAGCNKSTDNTDTTDGDNQPDTTVSYTLANVSEHNSESDCWVVVNDGVYDVTSFINEHPGGPEKITGACGTEISSIFSTVHENIPWDLLGTFKIGSFEVVEPVAEIYYTNTSADEILVTSPSPGDAISSPLQISGQARGTWFFEASAPVSVVDWDGLIIGQGYIMTTGDWMTEDFVDFTGEITFTYPTYLNYGTLILQNDNPSGLPENDRAVEIPIIFSQE